jgi:hypothetical protein
MHLRFDARKKYSVSGGNREKPPLTGREAQVATVELKKTAVDRNGSDVWFQNELFSLS